ncbi:MAG: outer membrane beta-barrel protein [Ferruginibacter sp.]
MKKIQMIGWLLFMQLPLALCAQEQKERQVIKGSVKEAATGLPLPFATVQMIGAQEKILAAAITQEDGSFLIDNFRPADSLRLQLTAVSYLPKQYSFPAAAGDTMHTGILLLARADGKSLENVQVLSRKALVKQLPGMLEYNVQADPDSRVKNLLDMMRKMPYLSVDGNDNLLYKGTGNYKVFINGRPSAMMENNLKEVLKNIPASTIQRIEIITNPSAKYDADISGGIINIIMAKKQKDGYSGTLNVNSRFPSGGPGGGGSISANAGRWGFSLMGGLYGGRNPVTGFSVQQQATTATLLQEGSRSSRYTGAYGGAQLSFEADSLHLLTLQLNGNYNKNKSWQEQETAVEEESLERENYRQENSGRNTGNGMDAAMNYQLGFARKKGKLLTFSYRYQQYKNDVNNRISKEDLLQNESSLYTQLNDNGSREHSLQADWVQPLHRVFLEAGIKGIARKNTSEFPLVQPGQVYTEAFRNRQHIIGVYSTVRFAFSAWSIDAGARLEQTFTDVQFTGTQTNVKQRYFNLVPNININKTWKDVHSIGFSFSQRIKRPGVNRLNPFTDSSNSSFIITGNPYLKAVVNNDMMISYSYQKKMFFNAGLSYSFSNKMDLKVVSYDTATHISKTSFENSGTAKRLGIDYNLNLPVTQKFSLSLNGYAAYFFIEGLADGALINNDMFTFGSAVNASYRFGKGWSAGAGVDIDSKKPAGLQNFTNGFVSTSVNLNKTMLKDKLSAGIFLNNPFSKYRSMVTKTKGYNFYQEDRSQLYFRSFGFSANYRFGKGKNAVKQTKRSIKNNDVSN